MVGTYEIKLLEPNKKFPINLIGATSRRSLLIDESILTYEVVYILTKDSDIEFVIITNKNKEIINVIESKEILNAISIKFGYHLYGTKPISKLSSRFPPKFIIVDSNKPIRSILPKVSERKLKIVIFNNNSIYGATNSEIVHSFVLKIIEEDSKETGRLQNMIIDKSIKTSNINCKTFMKPSLNAGGDFIYVKDLNEYQTIVTIADVSGKGTSASIVTSMMSMFFRSIPQKSQVSHEDIKNTIAELNRTIVDYFEYEKYVTLTTCLVNTKSKTLSIFNMGHEPTYIFNKNNLLIKKSLNIPIGISELTTEMIQYDEIIFTDSKALLFTDGVVELKNSDGIEYGEIRIEAIINSYNTIDEIFSYLVEDLISFSEDEYQFDDISFVLFELK